MLILKCFRGAQPFNGGGGVMACSWSVKKPWSLNKSILLIVLCYCTAYKNISNEVINLQATGTDYFEAII